MSYKRRKVLRALKAYGFFFAREGSKHTIYQNEEGESIPIGRHKEIDKETAQLIAKELDIPWNIFREKIL